MEAGTAGAQQFIRETEERFAVHRVGTPRTAGSNCYHCGGTDHRSDSCRFKRSICMLFSWYSSNVVSSLVRLLTTCGLLCLSFDLVLQYLCVCPVLPQFLLKGFKAKIYVEQDARPKYFKARSVPYSLKAKSEDQLETLR